MLNQPCNHLNRADSNYCTTCGAALLTRCQYCLQTIGRLDRFCTHCGIGTPALAAPQAPAPTAQPGQYNPFLRLRVRSLPLGALMGIPVAILAYIAAIGITGLSFGSRDPVLLSIASDIWVYASIVLWGWWQISRHRISLGRLVGRIPRGFPWHSIVGLVGLQILFSLATYFLIFIPISYVLPEYVRELLQAPFFLTEAETSSPILYNGWLIFVIVIVAPVVEELLFRGIILSRWANKWGAKRAIIFSSLLFGVLHVEGTLGMIVFGVVMSLLYLRTRTLLVPMAFHMLNNAIAVALSIWDFGLGDISTLEEFRSMLLFAVIGLAIATPILLLYIRRAWRTLGSGLPYFDYLKVPAAQ